MKDRLAKFIKIEGLSPSRFAEILGAQPSSISHLLAGRNKPGFDFLTRMIQRFPRVNPDWLLLGTGPMYRPTAGDIMPAAATTPPQPAENRVNEPPRPTLPEYAPHEAIHPAFDQLEAGDAFGWEAEPGETRKADRATQPVANFAESTISSEPTPERPSPRSAVSRIILCYGDGTFETLTPGTK